MYMYICIYSMYICFYRHTVCIYVYTGTVCIYVYMYIIHQSIYDYMNQSCTTTSFINGGFCTETIRFLCFLISQYLFLTTELTSFYTSFSL